MCLGSMLVHKCKGQKQENYASYKCQFYQLSDMYITGKEQKQG